jgi:hypothetical protein
MFFSQESLAESTLEAKIDDHLKSPEAKFNPNFDFNIFEENQEQDVVTTTRRRKRHHRILQTITEETTVEVEENSQSNKVLDMLIMGSEKWNTSFKNSSRKSIKRIFSRRKDIGRKKFKYYFRAINSIQEGEGEFKKQKSK